MRRTLAALLVAVSLSGAVVSAQGPFTAQIENFWRLISTGGRTFATLRVTTCVGCQNFALVGQTTGDLLVATSATAWGRLATGAAGTVFVGGSTFSATPSATSLTASQTALGTTSTDGLVLQNTTAATGGVTVQISPRSRWVGTAWDTAASQTVAFFSEVLPVSAATPTGSWKLGYSLNGAAATYPFIVNSAGAGTLLSGLTLNGDLSTGTALFRKSGSSGQANLTNIGATAGVGFDVATDAILKIRTTAQTGYATVDALAYQTSGVAGVGFALNKAQPADATARSSATFVHMGLGGAAAPCTITPTSTGRIVFTISGDIVNNTNATTVTINLAEGTGTAPVNNAAATGTVISAAPVLDGLTSALTVPFSITSSATGFALATAVWFDIQLKTSGANTGGTTNITCVANEI